LIAGRLGPEALAVSAFCYSKHQYHLGSWPCGHLADHRTLSVGYVHCMVDRHGWHHCH
jgi:hypothetical protein